MSYLQKRTLFPPQINQTPHPNLGIIVVIPCYNEPDVISSLTALKNCDLPTCKVEVILVINHGEHNTEQIKQHNLQTYQTVQKWMADNSNSSLQFFVLYHPNLAKKHAGVGLARKIGMDEAIYRLEKIDNSEGIIVCFDADASCAKNYFTAIEQHFQAHPKTAACSIHFEHPINGTKYTPEVYEYILQYELHLRYYVYALRYAQHPFAYQTIGSSMAVRGKAYQQQGGMNKRKAGEDFYFLQKFIQIGQLSELKNTKVIPSPRPSDRVPFGTGKAIGDMLEEKINDYLTYSPESFEVLRIFLSNVPSIFQLKNKSQQEHYLNNLPQPIQQYLQQQNFIEKITEIHQNTSNLHSFQQRFFQWFNAFQSLKYVHFARDHFYKNIPIQEAANTLLRKMNIIETEELNCNTLLQTFRKMG